MFPLAKFQSERTEFLLFVQISLRQLNNRTKNVYFEFFDKETLSIDQFFI